MSVIKPLQQPPGVKTQEDAVSAPPEWLWTMRALALAAVAPFAISVALMAVKGDPNTGAFAFALGIFSLPYITILVGLRKIPDRVMLAFAKLWGSLLALFSLLIVFPNLLRTGPTGWQQFGILGLAALFGGSHAGLVFGAIKLTRALPPEPRSIGQTLRVLFLAGVFIFLLMIVAVTLPGLLRSRMAANEASAVGATRLLVACAVGYYDTHPKEGFPVRPEVLGPEGTGCIDPVLLEAAQPEGKPKSGYRFQYLAGAKDADGKMSAFTVNARPTHFNRSGTRSYYSDDTGVLRFTEEDRPATKDDPPI